jgi:hypothetical protein
MFHLNSPHENLSGEASANLKGSPGLARLNPGDQEILSQYSNDSPVHR